MSHMPGLFGLSPATHLKHSHSPRLLFSPRTSRITPYRHSFCIGEITDPAIDISTPSRCTPEVHILLIALRTELLGLNIKFIPDPILDLCRQVTGRVPSAYCQPGENISP
ncbi:unnamed protein product [Penicillium olsonii]|nr:unnamed protein product [Penicillium olsonii]CAG7928843.1 unnamed protein product [Penicillium olsonii]